MEKTGQGVSTGLINATEKKKKLLQNNNRRDFETVAQLCFFVCVEVLPSSQPNGVMSSTVSLLNHTFTGQA